jgi:hypothetical protein
MIISRGLGGKGGKRSMITARGGAGSGGKCLKKTKVLLFRKYIMMKWTYRVITLVASDDGSGGGFSRIINGGGVLGGVGRSVDKKNVNLNEKRNDSFTFNHKWW